ncbi:E3 ubiquitin-protein ligase parkin-like isoform X3 [Paramacrobiotus metropolitanus]|uniref:E3 ubiquitin-protein ligase parkin-like isoform X3 n=1 Tax=Paramacrobiotus metropolitanus TaxID=2943436 RepID=UPI0024456BA5|nr:E3 ubiquitin-protein ligase parkin-like isoform X3 [Paramacrobiotus metropolitanus]
MMEFQLSVRIAGKESLDVRIANSATVRDLKRVIFQQAPYFNKETNGGDQNGAANDIIITFAGEVLADDSVLKDTSLRDCTILHAVPCRNPALCTDQACINEDASGKSDLIPVEQARKFNCTFYGYCKDVCAALVPALLRFSCSFCDSTNIVIKTATVCQEWDRICSRQVALPAHCYGRCGGASANLFFKCAAHPSRSDFDQIVYLRQVLLNEHDIPCVTCESVSSLVVDFLCDPTHVLCLDCFVQYGSILVTERRFYWQEQTGCVIPCPVGCRHGFIHDPHHFYLLGRKLYEKFKDFAAEERFVREGGIFCSEVACNTAFVDLADSVFASCPKGHRYCRTCRDKIHSGGCDEPVIWTKGILSVSYKL